MREGGATPDERIRFGLELVLARTASKEQMATLRALYESELAHYRQAEQEATRLATDPLGPLPQGMSAAEAAAWTVIANVLLNLDGVLTKG
jgi:NADPH:quinone reductase-like Zn-dependent oxidoreductase